jgi:hypothetical protein
MLDALKTPRGRLKTFCITALHTASDPLAFRTFFLAYPSP